MQKDILIYGRIDEWGCKGFFDALAEAETDSTDDTFSPIIRLNTGGGEPEFGWGIAAKINELAAKRIKVDGKAYSWGVYALCYAKKEECEALDVSQFMVHRAAYSKWFEESESFTTPLQENLAAVNKKLEQAFRNRVDVEAFENLPQVKEKGITVKDIFAMETRIDIYFSAADAKKIGLIGSIVKITPSKQTEINTYLEAIKTARKGITSAEVAKEEEMLLTETKPGIMTLEELQKNHPALYATLFALGSEAGKKAEKDRVGSILVFMDVDPVKCKAAIEKGEPLSETEKSEFALASVNPKKLTEIKKDSPEKVVTGAAETEEKTEAEKKLADIEAALDKNLGLNQKKS